MDLTASGNASSEFKLSQLRTRTLCEQLGVLKIQAVFGGAASLRGRNMVFRKMPFGWVQ